MQLFELAFRRCYGHGCGGFGDSRGSRKHNGVDLICQAGARVRSPVSGRVTKLGYCYADDLNFRYVEVSSHGYRFRIFYVEPLVAVGDEVSRKTNIGVVQSIASRYQGITPHVHFELMNAGGEFIDPTPVILAQQP